MNTNKKKAILTFDYEVFMGRITGSVDKCVIEPTQFILEILKENSAKAIFFVDTAWLLFLRDNFPDDFMKVKWQLKEIIKSGSSVELHLHPQWTRASVNGNGIKFTSSGHYKLASLDKAEVQGLFSESVALLESITSKKVTCFRAGGFCIEPFSHVKEAFEATGIKFDFSVAPGISLKEGRDYDYDYSLVPRLPYYRFRNDIQKPEELGTFTEIGLSTYKSNPVYLTINKMILILKKDRIFGDGIGIQEKSMLSGNSVKRLFRLTGAFLSLDKTSNFFFKYLLRTHFGGAGLLVFVSHPKTISPVALDNLRYVAKKFTLLGSEELNNL